MNLPDTAGTENSGHSLVCASHTKIPLNVQMHRTHCQQASVPTINSGFTSPLLLSLKVVFYHILIRRSSIRRTTGDLRSVFTVLLILK